MFQKNELIIYGGIGVCRVVDIGHPQGVRNIDASRLYYTLAPLYQQGMIYTPVDTAAFMRPVLTRQEAEELILQIPGIREEECAGRDQKMQYHSFLATHRCEDLVQLIKTTYARTHRERKGGSWKPSGVDQAYLRRAEGLLQGEFAVALGIEPGEVAGYIRKRLNGAEDGQEAAS